MKDKKPTRREKILAFEKKPIARAGREVLTLCEQIAASMSKMYKYQLGAEICHAGTDLVGAIYLALDDMGFSQKKEADIKIINEKLINLLVVVRVARDVNQVSATLYEPLISKIVSVKAQTENWLGFIQKENESADAKDK